MHYTKLYKICFPSHCLFCLKKFDAYLEKVRIVEHHFEKLFRLLQLWSNFYHCFTAAAKTSRIFHYGKKCAGRFVDHKYFSNFLGTVPTFGFRISIVENVRSQNFMKNWLSEVQKFYWIRLLFECTTYIRVSYERQISEQTCNPRDNGGSWRLWRSGDARA